MGASAHTTERAGADRPTFPCQAAGEESAACREITKRRANKLRRSMISLMRPAIGGGRSSKAVVKARRRSAATRSAATARRTLGCCPLQYPGDISTLGARPRPRHPTCAIWRNPSVDGVTNGKRRAPAEQLVHNQTLAVAGGGVQRGQSLLVGGVHRYGEDIQAKPHRPQIRCCAARIGRGADRARPRSSDARNGVA